MTNRSKTKRKQSQKKRRIKQKPESVAPTSLEPTLELQQDKEIAISQYSPEPENISTPDIATNEQSYESPSPVVEEHESIAIEDVPMEHVPEEMNVLPGALWRRVLAFAYDILFLLVLDILICALAAYDLGTKFALPFGDNRIHPISPDFYSTRAQLYVGITCLLNWLYLSLGDSRILSGTLGKKIFCLEVHGHSNKPISFWRSNARLILKITTTALTAGFGALYILCNRNRHTLYDLLSNTHVRYVKK